MPPTLTASRCARFTTKDASKLNESVAEPPSQLSRTTRRTGIIIQNLLDCRKPMQEKQAGEQKKTAHEKHGHEEICQPKSCGPVHTRGGISKILHVHRHHTPNHSVRTHQTLQNDRSRKPKPLPPDGAKGAEDNTPAVVSRRRAHAATLTAPYTRRSSGEGREKQRNKGQAWLGLGGGREEGVILHTRNKFGVWVPPNPKKTHQKQMKRNRNKKCTKREK